MDELVKANELYEQVSRLIERSREQVRAAVNISMVYTYFEIGRMIVEVEQGGNQRAEYGKAVLKGLSERLTDRFGRGYSEDNLTNMRRFFLVYGQDQISETPFRKFGDMPVTSTGRSFYLSWSHYLLLMRIDNIEERHFYEIEAARNGWSLSELGRQRDSSLYERLVLSRDKDGVRRLSWEGQVVEGPEDLVKDPYVLEFLGLPESPCLSESGLESRIVDQLEAFLLEMGTGFTFVERQARLTFDEDHYYVDLVFFNRILRCFVLVDLKLGRLRHQDLGQMQMYVNYYDRKVKLPDEGPTVGIVLCKDKKDSVVEMTLPEGQQHIFASKYQMVLPRKEDLVRLLEEGDS